MSTREEFLAAIRANPPTGKPTTCSPTGLKIIMRRTGGSTLAMARAVAGVCHEQECAAADVRPVPLGLSSRLTAGITLTSNGPLAEFCEVHRLPFVENWPEDPQSNTITFTIAVDAGPVLSAFDRIQSDLNNRHA